MKKTTLLIILLFATFIGNGQTTLTAGDIAFIGSNTDYPLSADDNVTFVLLKDIDAATTIIFTDMGWNDGTGFFATDGDGEFTWTSGSARSAGDVVTIDMSTIWHQLLIAPLEIRFLPFKAPQQLQYLLLEYNLTI